MLALYFSQPQDCFAVWAFFVYVSVSVFISVDCKFAALLEPAEIFQKCSIFLLPFIDIPRHSAIYDDN